MLDKYGRKKTLYTINILSIISWAILAASSQSDKDMMFAQLMIARIIIGVCIGLSSSPSAVYSSEIAHPNLRGSVSVLTSLMIAVGVLFIYVLGYFFPVCLVFSFFGELCYGFRYQFIDKLAACECYQLRNEYNGVVVIDSSAGNTHLVGIERKTGKSTKIVEILQRIAEKR